MNAGSLNACCRWWESNKHQVVLCILSVGCVISVYFASRYVGYVLGLLTGAAISPVAQVVAPLIFGLLTAIGVTASWRTFSGGIDEKDLDKSSTFASLSKEQQVSIRSQLPRTQITSLRLVHLMIVAWAVTVFCDYFQRGRLYGVTVRFGDQAEIVDATTRENLREPAAIVRPADS